MNPYKNPQYGSTLETILYPVLLLAVMWTVYWGEFVISYPFYTWGILPGEWIGLRGVILAPLLHSPSDFGHILNNSLPVAILLGTLVYFYHAIAGKVFFISWIFAGLGVWLFAERTGSYHIGMSSVVYALAMFLFVSGSIRKYRPLQGISLFVVFVYGSLVWGVLPIQTHVSWEGHLSGLIIGLILAFVYRKQGPQAPKYRYEIEKEMGIEPPDLEGQWLENVRLAQERHRLHEEMRKQQENPSIFIQYDYTEKKENPKND